MSSDIAIAVRNVSKAYKVFRTKRDRLRQFFSKRKLFSEHWSLRGVNIEVRRGETVGIVGRNGAGKSTLLGVVCGTTFPDAGTVEINGRLAALLELGAGFNPEFTGRENVYLNSRILGVSKSEIESRMADILDFAGIGEFIDQPVKTYSSGMYVRLAFAVATSIKPDILIVDEALAVGDEAFKRKCFARIRQIRDGGGTILFVSHSAKMVLELCDRAYLLDRGEIIYNESPKKVMAGYHKMLYAPPERADEIRSGYLSLASLPTDSDGDSQQGILSNTPESRAFYDTHLQSQSVVSYESNGARITNVLITDTFGQQVNVLKSGDSYTCRFEIHFSQDAYSVRWGNMIKNQTGIHLGGITSHPRGQGITKVCKGDCIRASLKFCCRLAQGIYFLNVGVHGILDDEFTYLHRIEDVLMVRVEDRGESLFSGIVDFGVD
jgi:lipopolysaccharide transport system ATP-binding protein